jgi:HTH-type transcriptional regulator/antitoxin HigA
MKKLNYLEVGVSIDDLVPGEAIHPGEVLLDDLKRRGISQKKFSELSGIHPTQLNEVIKGKRKINADMALQIGVALKMKPIIWLKSQMIYELDLAKIRANKKANARPVKRKLANAK